MSICDRKCENCISGQNGWLMNFILNTYDKLLPTSIWVRHFKELPKLTMYVMATIYQLSFWGIFAYFVVTAYYHGVRDSWLSYDKSSGHCDEVSSAVTGKFTADYNGNWQSSDLYDASRAVYSVDFKSFSRDVDDLKSDISYIKSIIDSIGERGKARDLAWNLVALSALQVSVSPRGRGKMTVSFSGDIRRMLQRENVLSIAVMSADGVAAGGCHVATTADFSAGFFQSSWSSDSESTECNKISGILRVGDPFSTRRQTQEKLIGARRGRRLVTVTDEGVSFRIDMRSLASAIAVNTGITDVSELTKIRNTIYTGYQSDDRSGAPTASLSTNKPTYKPTATPSQAAAAPTGQPTCNPTAPSKLPTSEPSGQPSAEPSQPPSAQPTIEPTLRPSTEPTSMPSTEPSAWPTGETAGTADTLWHRRLRSGYENLRIQDTPSRRLIVSGASDPFDLYYSNLDDGNTGVMGCMNGVCLLRFGTATDPIYGYPVIKHYVGTDCSDRTAWPASYFSSNPTVNADWVARHDHAVDLLLGVIIFPNVSDAKNFAMEAADALKAPNGDLTIPDRVYPSMKAAIDGDSDNYVHADVCGSNSDDSQRSCFLVIYNTYDNSDYKINYDHYELYAGACRNSLSYDNGLFSKNPMLPLDLVEKVYECVRKVHESIFIAVGLSFFNADLISRWGFAVLMFFVVGGLACCNNYNPRLGERKDSFSAQPYHRDFHNVGYKNYNNCEMTILPVSTPNHNKTFSEDNPLSDTLRVTETKKSTGPRPASIVGFTAEGRARGASALARRKIQARDGYNYEEHGL